MSWSVCPPTSCACGRVDAAIHNETLSDEAFHPAGGPPPESYHPPLVASLALP